MAALLLIGIGLVFYNFVYLPREARILRQRDENAMWTREVQSLTERLKATDNRPETTFSAVLLFDQLFAVSESFEVTSEGEAAVRECIPQIQKSTGVVEVIGHTDDTDVPRGLRGHYPSNWEYAGAKAAAVARLLMEWGVADKRIRVVSAGDTDPRADNSTPEGRAKNRRVEILVRP
jgi:chemotaxis protein MotB